MKTKIMLPYSWLIFYQLVFLCLNNCKFTFCNSFFNINYIKSVQFSCKTCLPFRTIFRVFQHVLVYNLFSAQSIMMWSTSSEYLLKKNADLALIDFMVPTPAIHT